MNYVLRNLQKYRLDSKDINIKFLYAFLGWRKIGQ